jgi:hypothetical protein
VVEVGVGVDHRRHRTAAAVLRVQREGGGRGLPREQRVDHDDAVVPLDEGHVGQVVAPDLVDPGDDLEETVLDQQLALTPQAGVRRVRARSVQVGVGVEVPDHATVLRADLALLAPGKQPVPRVREVLSVLPR